MTIETRAAHFALTQPIKLHAESLANSALGPFSKWIKQATVCLDDINGTHGGPDKRCRIFAMAQGKLLCSQALHEDLYVAIDRAAQRIRRIVVRSIKRPLRRERLHPQRPGVLTR